MTSDCRRCGNNPQVHNGLCESCARSSKKAVRERPLEARCEHCGNILPVAPTGRVRRFCDDQHRRAFHRENVW